MQYHYVLTLQWRHGSGFLQHTQHGTLQVKPGCTRTDVLRHLLKQMQEGKPGSPNVLFFSFEPDEIGGAS